jgi:hypothetical protein
MEDVLVNCILGYSKKSGALRANLGTGNERHCDRCDQKHDIYRRFGPDHYPHFLPEDHSEATTASTMMTGNYGFDEDPFSVPVRQGSSNRAASKKSSSRDSVSTVTTNSSKSSTESAGAAPRVSRAGIGRENGGSNSRKVEGSGQASSSRTSEQHASVQEGGFAGFGGFEVQAAASATGEAPRPRRSRRASIATSSMNHQPAPEFQAFQQEEVDFGYGTAEPSLGCVASAAPQRPRRTRRSSMYGDNAGPSGGDRQAPRISRSCDGLDNMMRPPQGRGGTGAGARTSRSSASVSECSVDSGGSGGGGSGERPLPSRRRAARRASVGVLGDTSTHSAPDYACERPHISNSSGSNNAYGYDEDFEPTQPVETAPAVKEERRRLQRNFSLEDFKSDGGGGADNTRSRSSRQLGASIGVNIVIPMAEPDKPRRQRRASLIGAIGAVGEAVGGVADVATLGLLKERKKPKDLVEDVSEYDPSKDMSRRSGLLDRVSSSTTGSNSRGESRGTSYSDRIMKAR